MLPVPAIVVAAQYSVVHCTGRARPAGASVRWRTQARCTIVDPLEACLGDPILASSETLTSRRDQGPYKGRDMAAADKQAGATVRQDRIVIEGVAPEIDCGRFPIKRIVGEQVRVQADIFSEGHESISCALLYREAGGRRWLEVRMQPLPNDRWQADFPVERQGRYQYTLLAWPDPFQSWRRDLEKRAAAGQDLGVDLLIGAQWVAAAVPGIPAAAAGQLEDYAALLRGADAERARAAAFDPELARLMTLHSRREPATRYHRVLEIVVDPARARFSTWYEVFPRSTAPDPNRHGTLRDLEQWLPRIAELGFDVLYLAPIHPIGKRQRKGRNNLLAAQAHEVGSPWAIGDAGGGHKSVHEELGTLEDFGHLVQAARQYGIDIALDVAFQASPDHPYVQQHPEWFRARPDGSIQYAENPPKKYQDIYPFDFDSTDAQGLWRELRSIFTFWIEQGVRIFRVDNPHTKPFPFWEWLIHTIKAEYPDVILLSEAFTRPKVMNRLAKLGFTQSYTYFAWRNNKWELTEYFRELTSAPVIDFFRANLWPNTPDILTEPFQQHGLPVFKARLILAATLGASYGIYGPPYEHMIHAAREPGSEEYLDSEKYQLRHWDFSRPTVMSELITRVNRIRRENPALHSDRSLSFHRIDNEQLIAYSKNTPDLDNIIITVVNLDPTRAQTGFLELPLERLGLPTEAPMQMHDLLTGAIYTWRGAWNYIALDPQHLPAHILRVERGR
jgi:starch synthase (maltosyl-transferring)